MIGDLLGDFGAVQMPDERRGHVHPRGDSGRRPPVPIFDPASPAHPVDAVDLAGGSVERAFVGRGAIDPVRVEVDEAIKAGRIPEGQGLRDPGVQLSAGRLRALLKKTPCMLTAGRARP